MHSFRFFFEAKTLHDRHAWYDDNHLAAEMTAGPPGIPPTGAYLARLLSTGLSAWARKIMHQEHEKGINNPFKFPIKQQNLLDSDAGINTARLSSRKYRTIFLVSTSYYLIYVIPAGQPGKIPGKESEKKPRKRGQIRNHRARGVAPLYPNRLLRHPRPVPGSCA